MATLTRDQILGADDLKRELVAVPEWGGDVYVRVMTGRERGEFEAEFAEHKGSPAALKGVRERTVAKTACDEKGSRIFTDDDAAALGGKSAGALDRLFDKALELARIGADEADLEAEAKN